MATWKYYYNIGSYIVAYIIAVGGIIWGAILLGKHEQGVGLLIGALCFLGIAIIATIRNYQASSSVSLTEIKAVISVNMDDGIWSIICAVLVVIGLIFFIALRPPPVTSSTGSSSSPLIHSQSEGSAPHHTGTPPKPGSK